MTNVNQQMANAFSEIEGILALEGLTEKDQPSWYQELKSKVIAGELDNKKAIEFVLAQAKEGKL